MSCFSGQGACFQRPLAMGRGMMALNGPDPAGKDDTGAALSALIRGGSGDARRTEPAPDAPPAPRVCLFQYKLLYGLCGL